MNANLIPFAIPEIRALLLEINAPIAEQQLSEAAFRVARRYFLGETSTSTAGRAVGFSGDEA